MISLKYGRKELIYETNRLTDIEKRLGVAKEEGVGEGWIGN